MVGRSGKWGGKWGQPTWLYWGQIVPYKCSDLLWCVTGLVDKWRATDVICLNFCKAFDPVPQDILVSKLGSRVFDRWIPCWIRNWLDGCTQRVVVRSSMSKRMSVTIYVPQGSVFGTSTVKHLWQWFYDSQRIPLGKSRECKERTWLKATKA